MTILEQLKNIFNPHSVNRLSAELRSRATGIPVVEKNVFTGIDNILIEGDVTLKEGAVVQRGTSLIAEVGHKIRIDEAAPIMDHVVIHAKQGDITIGTHVTVAHGSHVSSEEGAVNIANGGFVNINVRATGGTIEKDGYVGPGVVLTAGEVIPQGKIHFNYPHTEAGSRTINDDPTETGTKIIKRANIRNVSGQLFSSEGEALTIDEYPGYKAYIAAIQHLSQVEKSRQQNLPFENWLREYSLRQLSKAAAHMANEAQLQGPIVWHSAPLQSDILHLSKIRDVLNAAGSNEELAENIGNLIKAEAYFIGIYQPRAEEKEALSHAFVNAGTILQQTGEVLDDLTVPLAVSSYSTENAASSASGIALEGAVKETYSLKAEDIAKFRTQLAPISERATLIGQTPLKEITGRSLSGLEEIRKITAIREKLNKQGINIRQLPDGVHVKSYDGAVPVIADDAILVGVDLVGNVRIDSGAVIANSTIRTEQRKIPVYIGKDSVVTHTIVHTAGREQTPVEVGQGALIHGQDKNKVVLHGPYIGPESYVGQGAVVADEVLLQGVVFPKAVVDDVTIADSWEIYGGNISSAPLSITAKITKKLGYEQLPESLKNPDVLGSEDDTKLAIGELRETEKTNISQMLDEKVAQYGDIYKQSPHLQVDLLSLQIASLILGQSEENASTVQKLKHVQEGYEYLLGVKDSISTGAARLLVNNIQLQATLRDAGERLHGISTENATFPLWAQAGEVGATRAEIREVLYNTIHQSFREPGKEEARNQFVEERLSQHASIPKTEIEKRLIPNLGKIAERVASLSVATEIVR